MTHINTKKKLWMLMLNFYSSNLFSYVLLDQLPVFPHKHFDFLSLRQLRERMVGTESFFSDIGMTLGGFFLWVTNNLLIILLRDVGAATIHYTG